MRYLVLLGAAIARNPKLESQGYYKYDRKGAHQPLLLPNLVFAGVSKCGTSSMIAYLVAHPLIVATGNSRPDYFGETREARWFQHVQPSTPRREVTDLLRHESELLRARVEKVRDGATRAALKGDRGVRVHYTPHYVFVPHMASITW